MPTQSQPNILLILADDMGYSDIGSFGGEISTPHLDRLASEGTCFTQYYNCARCCPSRASLLTGLYPHQAGIGHMVTDGGYDGYRGFLSEQSLTIGEVLRTAGYETMYTGKWHTGGPWKRLTEEDFLAWRYDDPTHPTPNMRGFNRFYGNLAGGGSYFNIFLTENGKRVPLPEDFYTTDTYTTRAIEYMTEATAEGKPWLMHVAFNAPHWPLHAHESDIAKYRGKYMHGWDEVRKARHEKLVERGILNETWKLSERDAEAPEWDSLSDAEKKWNDSRMAVYAAQMECMDRNIGRMMQHLEASGQLDNTIVIFLADNGGCAEQVGNSHNIDKMQTRDGRPMHYGNDPEREPGGEDTFQSYGLPWANASNTPFRKFKHFVHEGGISTPLLIRYPKAAKAGEIIHEPCHLIDLAPTMYDFAGADYAKAQAEVHAAKPLEGRSVKSLLAGEETPSRMLFWEHEGNAAVRDGQFKAVKKNKADWELYDMSQDRTETVDLSSEQPELLKRLTDAYGVWADRCGVLPFPIQRA